MTGPDDAARQRTRARSFGSVAAQYAALRPGYPADAVAFLLPLLLGEQPRRVLDLGAGTGLLTAALVGAASGVVAVDPAPEMLAQLAVRLPDVAAVGGTAEALPLLDASVDAAVAGQAAHWFEPVAAAREIRRVLRPGGTVGLIWNTRDERVPWVRALGEVIAAEARDHEADQAVVEEFARELPATVERYESGVVQTVTPAQVVAGIGTRSYVAVMDDTGREELLGRVRSLLATDPDARGHDLLALPYRTTAYRLTPR